MQITKEESEWLLRIVKTEKLELAPFHLTEGGIELDESSKFAWAREIIIGMRLAQARRKALAKNE